MPLSCITNELNHLVAMRQSASLLPPALSRPSPRAPRPFFCFRLARDRKLCRLQSHRGPCQPTAVSVPVASPPGRPEPPARWRPPKAHWRLREATLLLPPLPNGKTKHARSAQFHPFIQGSAWNDPWGFPATNSKRKKKAIPLRWTFPLGMLPCDMLRFLHLLHLTVPAQRL